MLALNKIAYNQDVFFILLIISFLILAIIKGFYWRRATLFFMGVFAQRYANQYLREDNAFTERLSILTFSLMCINFTLIIVKIQGFINVKKIIIVLCFVVLFFFLKAMVIKFLGILFKAKDLSKLAIFFSMLFDKTLGFVLFPVVVCLCFFIYDISSLMLVIALVLSAFLLLLKLFWLWKIGTSAFGFSRFYIFLYLCMLEFFPILLIVKGSGY